MQPEFRRLTGFTVAAEFFLMPGNNIFHDGQPHTCEAFTRRGFGAGTLEFPESPDCAAFPSQALPDTGINPSIQNGILTALGVIPHGMQVVSGRHMELKGDQEFQCLLVEWGIQLSAD